MRRRRKKALGQIQHSIQRAEQRYNLRLSEEDMRQIANIVRKQDRTKCKFLHTISTRLSAWKVFFGGYWVVVAYDKLRHNVATLLPLDWTPDWKERGL